MIRLDTVDDRLRRWIARHRRVFALTGAGCSTASGIPDYRDEQGEWKRRPPVMIQALRTEEAVYRRYWARAYVGWPRFATLEPNDAHRALVAWEQAGTLVQIVTQNVDRLHQRAGSGAVIDLHGRLDEVVCLGCRERTSRATLQAVIAAANPSWRAEATTAPDGDAGADALLVAGSSLMVYSGFRFVRQAYDAGLPIAIVNRGRTRGDDLAELKIEHDVGAALTDAVGAAA